MTGKLSKTGIDRRHPRRPWTTAVLALLLAALPGTALAGNSGREGQSGGTSNEPVVSQEEAELLEKARKAAETDPAHAILLLREAITDDSSPALDFALGCFYHEKDDVNRALSAFRTALEKMPAFHRARENAARIHFQEEDYAEAADELVRLIDAHAGSGKELWKLLGYSHLMTDNPVAAEVAFRNALVLAPRDRELPLLLIRTLMELGRFPETRALIKRELARNPLNGELWKLDANIDLLSDRNREALVRLECAYRLGLTDPNTLVTLGDLFLELGLAGAALRRFETTAAMDRAPISRLLNAMEAYLAWGDTGNARTLLTALENRDIPPTRDERTRLRFLKAKLSESEGDMAGALEAYVSLLGETPLDPESLLAAGFILQRKERYEEALIYYERAARIGPEHEARSLVRRAQIAVEREDYEKAATLLDRAVEITPEAYLVRYLEQVRKMLE